MADGAPRRRASSSQNAALEMQRLSHSADKLALLADLVKHALTMAGVVFSVWICKEGLVQIVGNDPSRIAALAKVVDAFKLNTWLGSIVGSAGAGAAVFQRRGKQRAVKKVDELRKKLEAQDAYRAGSGLTETGATPKNDRSKP